MVDRHRFALTALVMADHLYPDVLTSMHCTVGEVIDGGNNDGEVREIIEWGNNEGEVREVID